MHATNFLHACIHITHFISLHSSAWHYVTFHSISVPFILQFRTSDHTIYILTTVPVHWLPTVQNIAAHTHILYVYIYIFFLLIDVYYYFYIYIYLHMYIYNSFNIHRCIYTVNSSKMISSIGLRDCRMTWLKHQGGDGSEVEHFWLGQALGYLTAPRLDGWAAVNPRTTQPRSRNMEVYP